MELENAKKTKENISYSIISLIPFLCIIKEFDCTDSGKVSDCECGTNAIYLRYNRISTNTQGCQDGAEGAQGAKGAQGHRRQRGEIASGL